MATVGIICEYNPFHLGHRKQFAMVRQMLGPDTTIVCLMSGDYVQRGEPAIFSKTVRAQAALLCGADLILELPPTASLSSAEGFAGKGVHFLSPICDYLCFGAETATEETLRNTAEALLSGRFSASLRSALQTGISFPAARQQALESMGLTIHALTQPNDILAVEYVKAILASGSPMKPLPILRQGNYHADTPDPENPSATSLRRRILSSQDWERYVPAEAAACFHTAPRHGLSAGETAILYRLRTMDDAAFAALPYGSEGLWRRMMHACRREARLEEILTTVKTKRYTRTRLNRMVLCAYLGIDQALLDAPIPYVRILGFSDRGRQILRKGGPFRNLGAPDSSDYGRSLTRWEDLYSLFRLPTPGPAGQKQRVFYQDR